MSEIFEAGCGSPFDSASTPDWTEIHYPGEDRHDATGAEGDLETPLGPDEEREVDLDPYGEDGR